MYTPRENIDRRRALADAMRQTPTGGNWAQALAHVLSQGVAGHQNYKANRAELENDQLKKQEMSQLAGVLAQGGQLQGPTQDGSTLTPRFQHPDVQEAALAHQLKTTEAEQAAQNRNANPTFGNSPIWGQDPNGNWVVMQSSNQGGIQQAPTPEGVTLYPSAGLAGYDPRLIGQKGDAETAVEVDNINATAQPAADAAAMETAAVESARTEAELDRQYRMYEQERQQELDAQRSKAWMRNRAKSDQVDMLYGLIDEAGEMAGFWTTGFIGSAAEMIAGTPAYDLVAKLDTIRANIGFDKLQEMRDSSPTGGALGQVSEMENRLLQAVWGNLENSQSEEQFKQNLERVRRQVQQSWERINDAYMADYGVPYFQDAPEDPNSGMTTEPVEELTLQQKADKILGL